MKYEFDSEENQEVLYDAFNKKIREDSCNLYEVLKSAKKLFLKLSWKWWSP